MEVVINNNQVTNHFFTKSDFNKALTYASFVVFREVFGTVSITGNTFEDITGVLGTYNLNTIKTLASLTTGKYQSTDFNSYQFVPVFATDLTNKIILMEMKSNEFRNSRASLLTTDFEGFFITMKKNQTTGDSDVLQLVIDDLKVRNIHIYGYGSLFYKYGSLTVTNLLIENYGADTTFIDTSNLYGAAIQLELKVSHK